MSNTDFWTGFTIYYFTQSTKLFTFNSVNEYPPNNHNKILAPKLANFARKIQTALEINFSYCQLTKLCQFLTTSPQMLSAKTVDFLNYISASRRTV